MNSQSTTSKESAPRHGAALRDEGEEVRRAQLIEVTIDSLAEVGFVGTTLAQIARRAGVSPGLVAHYFGDKDGLLRGDLSHPGAPLARAACGARCARRRRRAGASRRSSTPTSRRRSSTSAPAAPGSPSGARCCMSPGLKRVQNVYQRRMLSNLRHAAPA